MTGFMFIQGFLADKWTSINISTEFKPSVCVFFFNISFSRVKSVRGILILLVMLVDVGVGWCINSLTWKCSQVFIVWSDGATVWKLFKKARNSWTRVTDFKWNLLFSHLEKQITYAIRKATPRRKLINKWIFNFS